MPSVPMEMPSLTPMVLKRRPTRPASSTPFLTSAANRSRCMLQGLPSYQTLAMPTWALAMSASLSPTAYSMAWEAPWDLGWVIRLLIRLIGLAMPDSFLKKVYRTTGRYLPT